jgi:uncharacterized protein (TIGR02300 family)
VAKVNLGEKQTCPECEKKFYDLAKRPAVCPYCQTNFDPSSLVAGAIVVDKPLPEDEDEVVVTTDSDDTDIDEDEVAAKELELDGDAANFTGAGGDDGDDEATTDTPDLDGFSTSDDPDEDSTSLDDDDDEDELPPTGGDDEEVEEVEV